jgi:tetratricopeptide (TPR) repeat protein
LVLWPKRILYLAIAGGAFYAAHRAGLSWTVATAVVVAPLLVIDQLLRFATKGPSRRFEQQLMTMIQAGKNEELLPLYDSQHLLRFAAPRHFIQGKLALIYSRLGKPELAAAAYREALDDAPAAESYPLALGLANHLYEIGELEEAERVYRGAIDDERVNVQACANLARLIIKRGGDDEEAEIYLSMAVQAAQDGALRCDLVELLARRGKPAEARQQLERAQKELAGSENEKELAALERARQSVGAEASPPRDPGETAG